MTTLRLNPNDLPSQETLVFVPRFRGATGQGVFNLKRAPDKTEISVLAQLGVLLFRNAINFEAKSLWSTHGELLDFKEINHKSGHVKSSHAGLVLAREKFSCEQVMDPVAVLYSLRQNPLRNENEQRLAYAVRGENPISVEVFARGKKQQVVRALGASPRAVIRLELLITTPKHQNPVPVFQDGRSGFWIDQETNIPVEMSYQIPPLGSLSMALEEIKS
jgi:hypothetical protein